MLSLSKRAERQVFEAVLSFTLIVKPETTFFQFFKYIFQVPKPVLLNNELV